MAAGLALGLLCLWWLASNRDYEERIAVRNEDLKARRAKFQEPAKPDERQYLAQAWMNFHAHFPFLPKPKVTGLTETEMMAGIREVITAGGTYGAVVAHGGVPAPALPEKERRKHLYVVGKSGSGKSTFLEHVILEDLAQGRGVCVMGPEGELFRKRLLPLLPESRRDDLIYYAPADAENSIAFNPLSLAPGEDPFRAAEDLFTIVSRIFADVDLGPRMQTLLSNAFAVLVGRPEATLLDVKRLLEDDAFRAEVVGDAEPYSRDFWLSTFPQFPKGAALPVIHRLDRFLRPKGLRSLLYPASSFSMRAVLEQGRILFLDLYGLSAETRSLFGQLFLSKLQLEVMRREVGSAATKSYLVYADEFQTFAGEAEHTWRELLSRGRKYGLGLTLAHQYPGQLSAAVRSEIFGNVQSIVCFELGAKDAGLVRHELLQKTEKGLEPLPATSILELSVGQALMKLGGGLAAKVATPPPREATNLARADELIAYSRKRYGSTLAPQEYTASQEAPPEEPADWYE